MPPILNKRDFISEILQKQKVDKSKLLGFGDIVMCYGFRVIKNIQYYVKYRERYMKKMNQLKFFMLLCSIWNRAFKIQSIF